MVRPLDNREKVETVMFDAEAPWQGVDNATKCHYQHPALSMCQQSWWRFPSHTWVPACVYTNTQHTCLHMHFFREEAPYACTAQCNISTQSTIYNPEKTLWSHDPQRSDHTETRSEWFMSESWVHNVDCLYHVFTSLHLQVGLSTRPLHPQLPLFYELPFPCKLQLTYFLSHTLFVIRAIHDSSSVQSADQDQRSARRIECFFYLFSSLRHAAKLANRFTVILQQIFWLLERDFGVNFKQLVMTLEINVKRLLPNEFTPGCKF